MKKKKPVHLSRIRFNEVVERDVIEPLCMDNKYFSMMIVTKQAERVTCKRCHERMKVKNGLLLG